MKYSDDLLRVETRIASRKDLETFRFPILLPHKHQMVKKLIMSKHLQLEHAGTQTLSCLRESFWIIKSRKTVRGVIKRCTKCRRFSARPLEAVSISLPEDRVRDAAVFEVTGIDLCGPLFLKTDKKCWIVLAACAVYRTVHLELVSSLSTECFILALRRFIARRGRPSTIYSDNGKNLVGTANLLKKIDWKKIKSFASEKEFPGNSVLLLYPGGFFTEHFVLAAVLDSSTTSNSKGGRMSQTSNQATPNQVVPNQKAPTVPPLEGTDITEYINRHVEETP
ncbi:integrase catalytic domain-containing protein [Trichonephila clavipes]|nr:integrase catalytic domain-containing protein [Trichonephila clavipes]